MLPAVMEWNAPSNSERQKLVSQAMGHPNQQASDVLHDLVSGLGLPRGLETAGISRQAFDEIAQASLATPWVSQNPRKIHGAVDVLEILELAK